MYINICLHTFYNLIKNIKMIKKKYNKLVLKICVTHLCICNFYAVFIVAVSTSSSMHCLHQAINCVPLTVARVASVAKGTSKVPNYVE